jgi:CDP-4-dehydro-6-deoxyglucose reductase
MGHRMSLSRAGRLGGITRFQLQASICSGDLPTFEGMVDLDDLVRVFPDVEWAPLTPQDRKIAAIQGMSREALLADRMLPDKVVLAERLYRLGQDFGAVSKVAAHYGQVVGWLDRRLGELAGEGGAVGAAMGDLRGWLQRHLAEAPAEAGRVQDLIARDSVMRVMAAQVRVEPSGHEFPVEGNDTILEAALKAGIALGYGCSNGECGECRGRLVSGQVRKVHPHDIVLSDADRAAGAVLMCSYTAVTDLVIEARIAGLDDIPVQTIPATVRQVEAMAPDIVALHLTPPRNRRVQFLAGQRVTLSAGGASGDYHLSSCPCEARVVTVHVPRDNSPFARRVFGDMAPGAPVTITGPAGRFTFVPSGARRLVFAAWDEGFAPIGSLIRHTLSLDGGETMRLFWVAESFGHYRDNLCRSWADAYDEFTYRPLDGAGGVETAVAAILAECGDLAGTEVYAAGPAAFVDRLRTAMAATGLDPTAWHGEAMA